MGRILITGGTGLVGNAIVLRLLRNGHEVVVLNRRPLPLQLSAATQVHCDFAAENFSDVLRGIKRVDVLVHAAAEINEPQHFSDCQHTIAVNMIAWQKLLEWAARAGISKVIAISTLNFLQRPLKSPVTESHAIGASTGYAMSKLWQEKLMFLWSADCGTSAAALRISSPVPASYIKLPKTVLRIWAEAALAGNPLRVFGNGSRSQDFVGLDDIASAVELAIWTNAAEGVFNIASGNPISMAQTASLMAAPRKSKILFEGADPLEDECWNISIDRAKQNLGYLPTQDSAGVIETLSASLS